VTRGDADLELVIEGARVQTDAGWRCMDIGVARGRVAEMGVVLGKARVRVQAAGLLATPGFIDFHNHTDLQLLKLRQAPSRGAEVEELVSRNHNFVRQGVTTVVTGNCGEGFTDIDEWRQVFGRTGFGTNVCHFVPYGALRRRWLGPSSEVGPLGRAQIESLKEKLVEQMGKGAIGLSIAFDAPPQCYATTSELIEYCRVVADAGGIYLTHIRSECGQKMLEAVREAIEIGERSGVAVHLSHLRMYRSPDPARPEQVLELLSAARQRGIRITASQNPYTTVGGPFGAYFVSHILSNLRPDLPMKAERTGAQLREALIEVALAVRPENMLVAACRPLRAWEGQSVLALATSEGLEPVEVLERLYATGVAFLVCDVFSEDALETLMAPDFVFTSSNGEVAIQGEQPTHPRCFGAFPRKLVRYALGRKVIGFERALASMSSGPADFLGLAERGRLAVGYAADLVLLDPESLDDRLDYVRPATYPRGISHVVVNGELSLERQGPASGRLLGRGAKVDA
jgi:N-acyl-D-amino-acid deacylase